MTDQPWWQTGAIYQIYPRSFADSNNDGVGDLAGITARLGYLADLGVSAIWLSPFYPSPMDDFGYDVTDHTGVDPLFGSVADAIELIETAHRHGLRVLVDFIPNHTSHRHPWFEASRSSRDHTDWYYWRSPRPTAARRTTGCRSSAAQPGPSTPIVVSTTTTPTSPSSRTSTGAIQQSARRSTTYFAPGWVVVSMGSASTRSGNC